MDIGSDEHKRQALWACLCAEHVLPLFEAERPGDQRPRQAIDACRAWASGKKKPGPVRTAAFAAHAAARESHSPAAVAAARAAGQAAGAAQAPGHIPQAIDYALRAVLASGGSRQAEQLWQARQLRALQSRA